MRKYKIFGYWWIQTNTKKNWRKKRVQRTFLLKPHLSPTEVEIEFKKVLGEEVIMQGYFEII